MKGRKNRAAGGGMDSPSAGVKDWERDEKENPSRRDNADKIEGAAEEKKRGGKVKKLVGKVRGKAAEARADRKPRKSGGRSGSNMNPLSSAHAGTSPRAHKVTDKG